MKKINIFLLKTFISIQVIFLILTVNIHAQNRITSTNYFPNAGDDWEKRTPLQVGIDVDKLKVAIDFAVQNEAKLPRDMELAQAQTFGREPRSEERRVGKECCR